MNAHIGLALLIASAISEPVVVACEGSRLVELSLGCIELPCEYELSRGAIIVDGVGGNIESSRTGERVGWFSLDDTWWLRLPFAEKVVWRRVALSGWHLSWRALFEWNGRRNYLVTNRDLWLMAPADRPEVLDLLKSLASGYRYGMETSACEQPRTKKP